MLDRDVPLLAGHRGFAEESSTQIQALIADSKEYLLEALTHGIVPDDDDRRRCCWPFPTTASR